MEEVDNILIHALKQVGTEVSEETGSIHQFSSELIVEAVVRCIRVIDPGLGGALPTSLPPGMSARFRVGMSLAQACQDIGYKGEIGYQTFLYSNEPEIRSLLMFLVEKLPRESAEASDQPTGKSGVLQKAIAAAIKAQLAVPWLPPNCRLPLHGETQSSGARHSFHVQPLSLPHRTKGPGKKQLKELEDYQRDILPPVTAQPSHHASVVASILEQHTADLSATQEWDNEWNTQGLLSRLTPQASHPTHYSRGLQQGLVHVAAELLELLLEGRLLLLLPELHVTLRLWVPLVRMWSEGAEPLKACSSSDRSEAERGPPKALSGQGRAAERSCSSMRLRSRDPICLILNTFLHFLQLESSRKLSEIKSLHDKIRVSTEEAKKKEETYKQLVTHRTCVFLDEPIFNVFMCFCHLKDAKKDESVRKSYKYLAALHENCSQLIQTIEDTGTILREIRDLEEQIETENSSKTVANLERILEDYKAMRQENSALAAKVREG
ncbi:coiled-coil domain-containing protein 22 [Etheostoma cragini]|uniref:coiled-coil domain-containing protein 22 n=1 Tax=Etheostoma cragini TaxID=417921 RepID=UPI00155EB9B4|nr:coiled-coil domain-containing protein 22 [Etheostoma cragini]